MSSASSTDVNGIKQVLDRYASVDYNGKALESAINSLDESSSGFNHNELAACCALSSWSKNTTWTPSGESR